MRCSISAHEVDVFVYNVRPQAMARLGLGYETLSARNPGIIYCGAVGYGSGGPDAGKAVYDDLMQAGAGIAGLFASVDGAPRYAPVNICDRVVGLYLAIAIVSALHHRARTGEGQQIEVPMLETMAQFVLADHMGGGAFAPPHRSDGIQAAAVAHARPLPDARRPSRDRCLYGQALARVFAARRQAGPPRHRSALSQSGNAHAACRGHGPLSRGAPAACKTTQEWLDALAARSIFRRRRSTRSMICSMIRISTPSGFFSEMEHPTEGTLKVARFPDRIQQDAGDVRGSRPTWANTPTRCSVRTRNANAGAGKAPATARRL